MCIPIVIPVSTDGTAQSDIGRLPFPSLLSLSTDRGGTRSGGSGVRTGVVWVRGRRLTRRAEAEVEQWIVVVVVPVRGRGCSGVVVAVVVVVDVVVWAVALSGFKGGEGTHSKVGIVLGRGDWVDSSALSMTRWRSAKLQKGRENYILFEKIIRSNGKVQFQNKQWCWVWLKYSTIHSEWPHQIHSNLSIKLEKHLCVNHRYFMST